MFYFDLGKFLYVTLKLNTADNNTFSPDKRTEKLVKITRKVIFIRNKKGKSRDAVSLSIRRLIFFSFFFFNEHVPEGTATIGGRAERTSGIGGCGTDE